MRLESRHFSGGVRAHCAQSTTWMVGIKLTTLIHFSRLAVWTTRMNLFNIRHSTYALTLSLSPFYMDNTHADGSVFIQNNPMHDVPWNFNLSYFSY